MHTSAPDAIARATRLVQSGALVEAGEIVRRTLAEQPQSAAGLTVAGFIAVRRSELAEAIRQFKRASSAGAGDDPRALLNLARAQEMAGRPAEALATARKALARFPEDPRARGLVILLLLEADRAEEAAALLRPNDEQRFDQDTSYRIGSRLAAAAPHQAAGLDLLMAAARSPGRSLEPALRALVTACPATDGRAFGAARRLLVLCPDAVDAMDALERCHQIRRDLVRRAAWVWQGSCVRPDDRARLTQAAQLTFETRWPLHGIAANSRLLQLRPKDLGIVGRICLLHARNRELSKDKADAQRRAVDWGRSVIAAAPVDPRIWDAVAGMLKDVEAFDEAAELWPRITARFPSYEALHYNRGLFLDELGRLPAAIRSLRAALVLKPDYQKATNILSLALARGHDLHAAVRYVKRAVIINPRYPSCWINYGSHLRAVGRYDQAVEAFRTAQRIGQETSDKEHEAAGAYNLAMTYLSLGELETGFKLIESRWATRGFPSPKRRFRQAIWQGPQHHPRSNLLVYLEQGLGDEVMTSWYFPLLRRDTRRLVVDCDARLIDLFTRTYEGIEFVPRSVEGHPTTRDPGLTHKIPILHAPQYYVPELKFFIRSNWDWSTRRGERFPSRLALEDDRLQKWDRWLEQRYPGRPRLSLSWRSKMRNRTRDQQYVTLQELARALPDGVVGVNLQYSSTPEEMEELAQLVAGRGIEIVTPEGVDLTNDLEDILAILQVSDAAVTPMISLAWMSGAVGCPAYVFRTSRERAIWHQFGAPFVPWAPSMRLFFRDPSESWDHVIGDLRARLTQFLAHPPERRG